MRAPYETLTEEQYLIREPQAEYKSEFRDGEVVAMVGASVAHSLITINLAREISLQLKNRPCRTYSSDTRIKVSRARFYTYPDLSVACGESVFDLRDKTALTNPTLIVEVLSPGTEDYDRGDKFNYYKKLDSLKEYVLVAQDRICVERFSRQESGRWKSAMVESIDDILELPAIGCRIAVRDVYDKVELP
jgi:Uma2 family endonuclease